MASKVFISYSRQDSEFKDQIVRQLLVLERQGLLTSWSDDRIEFGSDWYQELRAELDAASIIVLLISADFLTSDFIAREEIPQALRKREELGARLIPVYCRPCAWETVPWLSQLQLWPRTGKPLWKNKMDDATNNLSDLAREIARLIGKPIPKAPLEMAVATTALQDIETSLSNLNVVGNFSLQGIADVVRATIATGAPLYNAGQGAACAEIYTSSVRQLNAAIGARFKSRAQPTNVPARRGMSDGQFGRNSMPSGRGSADPRIDALLLSAAHFEVSTADAFASSGVSADRDLVAWQIRHTFNRILMLERGSNEVEAAHTGVGNQSSVASSTLRCLESIVDEAGRETSDDLPVAINTSATLALVACRRLSSIAHLSAQSDYSREVATRKLIASSARESVTREISAVILCECSSALRSIISG